MLPDGSGVVFEVTNQFSVSPGPPPPEEGIFFVRANGRGLRPLGPASRFPPFLVFRNPTSSLDGAISFTGDFFPVSPDGRKIALIDLGPFDAVGHEAPQIFLLDLRSGERTQLTHQSHVISEFNPVICCQHFLNSRTITYHIPFIRRAFTVKTNGKSPEKKIPPPKLGTDAHIVTQFNVTGTNPKILFVRFSDRPAVNGGLVDELVLIDGKNLLQITNFGRGDTGNGGSFIARGRVFFTASANPSGENPAEICQLFSINKLGGELQSGIPPTSQLTHLPSDGRLVNGCWGGQVVRNRPVNRIFCTAASRAKRSVEVRDGEARPAPTERGVHGSAAVPVLA